MAAITQARGFRIAAIVPPERGPGLVAHDREIEQGPERTARICRNRAEASRSPMAHWAYLLRSFGVV
jgi:hypothetical protein